MCNALNEEMQREKVLQEMKGEERFMNADEWMMMDNNNNSKDGQHSRDILKLINNNLNSTKNNSDTTHLQDTQADDTDKSRRSSLSNSQKVSTQAVLNNSFVRSDLRHFSFLGRQTSSGNNVNKPNALQRTTSVGSGSMSSSRSYVFSKDSSNTNNLSSVQQVQGLKTQNHNSNNLLLDRSVSAPLDRLQRSKSSLVSILQNKQDENTNRNINQSIDLKVILGK